MEREKMERELKTMLIILGVIIVLLIIMVVAVLEIRRKNSECIRDPLIYGAERLEEANDAEILCSCNALSEKKLGALYFNSEKVWIDDFYSVQENLKDWNLSIGK